jgi:4a-hydroxytetrahydrobiopterin dehydratase
MLPKLSDLEIQRAIGSLPGWARRGDALVKTFTFRKFSEGIDFVQKTAKAADKADHHPDIDIRYTKITFSLSTHDSGGITDANLTLASTIEGIAEG